MSATENKVKLLKKKKHFVIIVSEKVGGAKSKQMLFILSDQQGLLGCKMIECKRCL